MVPNIGPVEVILSCIFGLVGIGLPIAMLVFLYMIYNKVKAIEEMGSPVINWIEARKLGSERAYARSLPNFRYFSRSKR